MKANEEHSVLPGDLIIIQPFAPPSDSTTDSMLNRFRIVLYSTSPDVMMTLYIKCDLHFTSPTARFHTLLRRRSCADKILRGKDFTHA